MLYPIGYRKSEGTIDEVMAHASEGHEMEPEYARRLRAWIISQGGHIGIGDGWRPNPSNTSPASQRGRSFHQSQQFDGGFFGHAAVDLVARNYDDEGNTLNHRAPRWDEVPTRDNGLDIKTGLHCFISGEPWHIQALEMRGYRSWVTLGRQRPVPDYDQDLDPVDPIDPPTQPPIDPPTQPPAQGEVDVKVQELVVGQRDDDRELSGQPVMMFQNQASKFFGKNLKLDGLYGPKSEQACKDIQAFFGLVVDGRCGPKTWDVVLNMPMNYID